MSKQYKFEQLNVWKLSRGLVNVIYAITKDFPDEEKFGLTSQIRRAALSVLLNITEGCDRGSDKEFARFLRIANTSLQEVIAASFIALDQTYISKNRFEFVYDKSQILSKKINAFIKYLNSSSSERS